MSIAQVHAMKKVRFLHLHPRLVTPMLIALLVASCQERLALQDEYFAPFSRVVTDVRAETERLVTYHEALQVLRRPCTTDLSTAAARDAANLHSPVPGVTSVGENTAAIVHPQGPNDRRLWQCIQRLQALG